MQKFSKWLIKEAISATAVDSVNKIVKSFLAKKLGTKVYSYPGVEQYANSTGKGFGVRYFYQDKSIRFNWKSASINAFTLDSVDLWDGTSHDPNWHMDFDAQQSLVKTLPLIVDFIKSPFGAGTFYLLPDDSKSTSVKEEYITEAAQDVDAFDFVIQKMKPNTEISSTALTAEYGSYKPYPVLKAIKDLYPQLFQKKSTKLIFVGTADDVSKIKAQKDSIIGSLGGVKITVSKGGSKETYAPNEQESEIEQQGIERVAYEEQLKHLAVLMKMVIKGATNALFVAGRGGTGKTQTVEDELAKAGLQDGEGYYKNTGSASPIGIYISLYNNRDGIVLFDDCDSALADQEGRNLIKAATDTKKIRKVAWNKKSSVIVPKDQFEDAESDDGVPTNKHGDPLYPNSFEFTGRVIFISNLKLDKLDPDGALRTRGFIIEIDPTDAEMIDYMAKIAPKIRLEGGVTLKQSEIDDVIAEIRKSPKKSDISLRKLVRGLNVKAELGNDPMWKTILKLYA